MFKRRGSECIIRFCRPHPFPEIKFRSSLDSASPSIIDYLITIVADPSIQMALRAPLDVGPCMLRSSFGDWKLQLCASTMIHIIWYTNLRGVLFVNDETCWFIKNIETDTNAEFVQIRPRDLKLEITLLHTPRLITKFRPISLIRLHRLIVVIFPFLELLILVA
ncbi:hypothetical protein RHSIM_Rhsim06G0079200 [Rhododendron simsii]|uniref:Uncharacterized protein n=1 Tax=Rhododendron simsii TaxID=118357 RepID=A0A834GVH8_RHOSS|nr:hypothetical protein RHSIM_Rhsim06G0079200 [Rhododendron simsii]